MTAHEKYMERAIELAKLGLGRVRPNPMVGCVIVKDDKIIGEGYHRQYGGPHAEVNAVNNVKDINELEGATVYVTLEPCSHFGKTPPCTKLLIEQKIKSVFISHSDPNPLVAGKGVQKLIEAGIEVKKGLLEEKSREMNRRFLTNHEKNRPYIILKWAQTSDGFIARENYDSKWISNKRSRQLVHKWRSEEHAIFVGKNTALYDNPKLTVRDWSGQNPIRILLDHKLKIPQDFNLFDGTTPTIVLNEAKAQKQDSTEWVKISSDSSIPSILQNLADRHVQSVIVEGGANTIKHFIDSDMWDEARVFEAKSTFGKGISAPQIAGNLLDQKDVEGDTLKIYRNHGRGANYN